MNPFDPEPPGGDGRRRDRLLVWTATAGALGCSALIFVLTNAQPPEPVAEPMPTLGTSWPAATITTTAAATTTSAVPASSTSAPPATSTKPGPPTRTVVSTTTPAPTSGRRCAAASWQRDTAYDGGTVVTFGGSLWVAKWWNYNSVPGQNAEGVWEPAQSC